MSTAMKNLKVVMVDDDNDDLFLTGRSFKKSHYNVEFIGLNSATALFDHIEAFGIRSIDILLLDLNMPRMGGQQILSELKRYPGHETLNAFIFSTSTHAKDKKDCIENGAKGYFAKPANAEQTKNFIDSVMEHISTQAMQEHHQKYQQA